MCQARSGAAAAAMQGFLGGNPDPQQLQATMLAIEQACSLIQMHMNPSEAEKVISSLHSSLMPYQACRFILDSAHICTQHVPMRPSRVVALIFDIDQEKETLQLFTSDPAGYFLEHKTEHIFVPSMFP